MKAVGSPYNAPCSIYIIHVFQEALTITQGDSWLETLRVTGTDRASSRYFPQHSPERPPPPTRPAICQDLLATACALSDLSTDEDQAAAGPSSPLAQPLPIDDAVPEPAAVVHVSTTRADTTRADALHTPGPSSGTPAPSEVGIMDISHTPSSLNVVDDDNK